MSSEGGARAGNVWQTIEDGLGARWSTVMPMALILVVSAWLFSSILANEFTGPITWWVDLVRQVWPGELPTFISSTPGWVAAHADGVWGVGLVAAAVAFTASAQRERTIGMSALGWVMFTAVLEARTDPWSVGALLLLTALPVIVVLTAGTFVPAVRQDYDYDADTVFLAVTTVVISLLLPLIAPFAMVWLLIVRSYMPGIPAPHPAHELADMSRRSIEAAPESERERVLPAVQAMVAAITSQSPTFTSRRVAGAFLRTWTPEERERARRITTAGNAPE